MDENSTGWWSRVAETEDETERYGEREASEIRGKPPLSLTYSRLCVSLDFTPDAPSSIAGLIKVNRGTRTPVYYVHPGSGIGCVGFSAVRIASSLLAPGQLAFWALSDRTS